MSLMLVVCDEGGKTVVQAAIISADSLVHIESYAQQSSHCSTARHHHGMFDIIDFDLPCQSVLYHVAVCGPVISTTADALWRQLCLFYVS